MTTRLASVAQIRLQFPALERSHRGFPVAYFDGPGGTQVPDAVARAVTDYLLHHNANTHWNYPTSGETDLIIEQGRAAAADLLGGKASEIVFGANMTTLTFHLARALGRMWGPGDEVVVTELDHHANIAPWEALAVERGITVRTVPFNPGTGALDLGELRRLIGPRTKLVAIGMASNALGTVTDVKVVAEWAHEAGALIFVDAVHAAPHLPIDVVAMGCDFLGCSAYKFYGPHIGILWGRHELLQQLDTPKLRPAPDTAPERLETGTQNHEGIAGTIAAIDFLAGLVSGVQNRRQSLVTALEELHRRSLVLTDRLWSELNGISQVQCFGPGPRELRTPTVSFSVAGVDPAVVAEQLAEQGIFTSHGDFYAATVVERLQVPGGLVRIGAACYTNSDEVDRLTSAVKAIAAE